MANSTTNQIRFNELRPRDAAIQYASMGLAVFPLWRPRAGVCTCRKGSDCSEPGKHPRTHHGLSGATTDARVLKRWKWESANIGIRTGAESGIVVIDVDDEDAWKALREEHGSLTPCPYVATPRPGWHLFYRHPGIHVPSKTKIVDGIDIRADGGYVVAPPSLHFNGGRYLWQDFGDFPELPASWVEFLSSPNPTHEAQEAHEVQELPCRPNSEQTLTWERIAESCVPKGPGNRNRSLVLLCRKLRALPEFAKRDAETAKPVFDVWFKAALPHIRTKDRLTNYGEFCAIWDWVKCPWGAKVMTTIQTQAETSDAPKCAAGMNDGQVLLVKLCRELQRMAGAEPFFLSSRTAADATGVHWTTTNAWLRAFVAMGVLRLVRKGTKGTRNPKASEWRYLHPLDG